MHPPIRRIFASIVSILLILIGFFTATCAQLPPEIRADAYLMQAEQTIRDGDHVPARTVIRKICALQEQHDLDLPDGFHFRYAKGAVFVEMASRRSSLF